ncbi:MAG TPA: threonine synthase, partial [Bauldia sp.]|nr:threonine synthase [Bauldia sp.]
WPHLSKAEIASLRGEPYVEVAFRIMLPFVGDAFDEVTFRRLIGEAYASFETPDVAPLRPLGDSGLHLLELFHGPTLAFKDVAMQLLARMMDYALAENGEHTTVVGATSGDTGAAAIEAFGGRQNVDVFILFPKGRVSPFQQRQMTTTGAANVHPVAIEGTFDDCQAIVKQLFGKAELRREFALSGVNSINWARIIGQIVYYFTAAAELGSPDRPVSFAVPTGNFGDIFAGYAAKRMGLPIERLVIATNVNDILARALANGRYDVQGVMPTTSPSMDIQVSSNFERLLWEASNRDAAAVRTMMGELQSRGVFTIGEPALSAIRRDFQAGRADEAEVAATIGKTYRETGFLPDPHTAVGIAVAGRLARPGLPMVALSTAHPAKFAAAVKAAAGVEPQLPQGFASILTKRESYATLANEMRAVEEYIRAKTRAHAEKA